MNNTIKILLLIFCSSIFLPSWAQNKGVKKGNIKKEPIPQADTVKAVKNVRNFLPGVFLGYSDFAGGKIKKKVFDSLMKQGLSSHDTLGNAYKVIGFDFIYAERNLYEDSAANLEVVADYLYEYCPGDTVSHGISETLYRRTKVGDTVFIEKVKVAKMIKSNNAFIQDSNVILGKSIKCVIIK